MIHRTSACLALCLVALVGSATAQGAPVRYPPARDAFSFFPSGVFHRARPDLDTFQLSWYGGALLALHEPPLYGARPAAGMTVLRFLWLRSFHPEVAVRVESGPDRCRVVTTVLGRRPDPAVVGRSGSVPMEFRFAPVARRDSSDLPGRSCEPVLRRLRDAQFWSAHVTDSAQGVDGAEWVLEGVSSTLYHVLTRWAPDRAGARPVRAAGLAFLLLGHAAPSPREIY